MPKTQTHDHEQAVPRWGQPSDTHLIYKRLPLPRHTTPKTRTCFRGFGNTAGHMEVLLLRDTTHTVVDYAASVWMCWDGVWWSGVEVDMMV